MIGIIVTGHGTFASGIMSAVNLLAGKPEHLYGVEYLQEDTTDDLEEKLRDAIGKLEDCSDGICVFADLVGGAPFNMALELKNDLTIPSEIEVVGGVNIGMLMQMNIARGYISDISTFASMAIEEGRNQIQMDMEFVPDSEDEELKWQN